MEGCSSKRSVSPSVATRSTFIRAGRRSQRSATITDTRTKAEAYTPGSLFIPVRKPPPVLTSWRVIIVVALAVAVNNEEVI